MLQTEGVTKFMGKNLKNAEAFSAKTYFPYFIFVKVDVPCCSTSILGWKKPCASDPKGPSIVSPLIRISPMTASG